MADAKMVGKVPASEQMNLAIGLPLRNQQALHSLIQKLYDAQSPLYRRFLTPEKFAKMFGPSASDYEALIRFVESNGLTVTHIHPNRLLLDVSGRADAVQKAFGVRLQRYRDAGGRNFYAPANEPVLDLNIPIQYIAGLDNSGRVRRNHFGVRGPAYSSGRAAASRRRQGPVVPNYGTGLPVSLFFPGQPGYTYAGYDFRNVYVPCTSLAGAGQTIALFEADNYFPADVSDYQAYTGLPAPHVTVIPVGQASPQAPSCANGEVILDIDMAWAMAPGAQILVYEGPNNGNGGDPCSVDNFAFAFNPEDILNRIATDDLAKQISSSWAWSGYDPNIDSIFLQYAAQGQSFFQASGDLGAYNIPGSVQPDVWQPAINSPLMTVVGGTKLTTSGSNGSSVGAYVSETTWNNPLERPHPLPTVENSVSGGGYCGPAPNNPLGLLFPAWQGGTNLANPEVSASYRNVPDVAMVADDLLIPNEGYFFLMAGTSASAPLWAGFMALANQQAGTLGPVGFANPYLYSLAGYPTGYNGTYFHDVHDGSNNNYSGSGMYHALTGYDLTTGLGSPQCSLITALSEVLAETPTPTFTVTPTPMAPECGVSQLNLRLEEYTSCGSNQSQQFFRVINQGTTPVTLSDISVKFWVDDTSGKGLAGEVYYGGGFGPLNQAVSGVAIGSSSFAPACGPDANYQANWEVTLSNTDTRSLAAGTTWGNIQTAVHLADWSNFTPGTGFWYSPCGIGNAGAYANDVHYALYYQGNLVTASGGVPPACRPLPTCTLTWTPTPTPSTALSFTPTETATGTPTLPQTDTPTGTPTWTASESPTGTEISTPTVTATGCSCASFSHQWPSAMNPPYSIASDGTDLYVGTKYSAFVVVYDSAGVSLNSWNESWMDFAAGIAVNPGLGYVYVTNTQGLFADSDTDRVKVYTLSGAPVTSWGGTGTGNGQFNQPLGIAVNRSNGNVYVADLWNDRVEVFDPLGNYLFQWGGTGTGNGQFNHPTGVAVDAAGNVYVVDSLNSRVEKFTSTGGYLLQWGSAGSGGGQFNNPQALTVSPATGNIWVADSYNDRVEQFDSNGNFICAYGEPNNPTQGNGHFLQPFGITADAVGTIYVADTGNALIQALVPCGGTPVVTPTPTGTATPTETWTATNTATETSTWTPTHTATQTETWTATETQTETFTPTPLPASTCAIDWALVGTAQEGGNAITFTQEVGNQAGAAWDSSRINLADSFAMTFSVYLGSNPNGADGMAFVLQSEGLGAIGGSGSGLGYGNITADESMVPPVSPSVDVEIDTWQNWGPNQNDPPYDHIAVLENGILQSYAAGPVQASATQSNIKDGAEHVFAVQWDAGTDTLRVYFDGSLRVTYTKDVVAQIFGGNPEVYFGWTGSTGSATNIQYVRVSDAPCPPTPSPTATLSETPTDTATESPTETATWTPTDTPTLTDTPTETATGTWTSTETSTLSPTATGTDTETSTWTPTPTVTDSATETPTNTPLPASTCAIDWALVGTASQEGNAITFTQPVNNQAGAAWDTSRISLANSFAMTFAAYLGANPNGADGLAFVLQSEGLGAIGGSGMGIGYGNYTVDGSLVSPVSPSVVVEIDTWRNGAPQNDPPYDHIGVLENGQQQTYVAGPVQASATEPNIKDGAEHVFAVQWDAGTDTLSVYFDGSLRVTYTKDVVAQIFGGNPEVYFGWTGSTGAAANIQYVKAVDVPCPPTPTATFTSSNTPTDTATGTATATGTPTETPSPTMTPTRTATDTWTFTPTRTATDTRTLTPTRTATDTRTLTPTRTATGTRTLTPTRTATDTRTLTPTRTATDTRTLTPTRTATDTRTLTPTRTVTGTRTSTPTPTSTDTPTATWTGSPTDTATSTATPDLTLAKSVNLDVAHPGDTLTYTIGFCDRPQAGPATSVKVTDEVPEFTTFLWATGPSDNPLVGNLSAPPPGGVGAVEWNIPVLGPGLCSAVTMAVVVDANVNTPFASMGHLFGESFPHPPFGANTPVPAPFTAGSQWNSTTPNLYPAVQDPGDPGNLMASIRSAFTSGDPLTASVSFTGTTTLEFEMLDTDLNTQSMVWFGPSVFIGIDSTSLRFANDYVAHPVGDKMFCRLVYEPAKGIGQALVIQENSGVTLLNDHYCGFNPVTGPYQLRIQNSSVNQAAADTFLVDDFEVCRGVANGVRIEAPGAATRFDCIGTKIQCPEAATPTETWTTRGTATDTATETSTWTPTHTATQTETWTATETQTQTFTPTPLPASTCVIDWALVGTAQEGGNAITFTQEVGNQAGAAWDTSRISLADSFAMTFAVYLGSNPNGADGMAFVLQSEGLGAIGGSGAGIGYGNQASGEIPAVPVSPSLDVEIDTWPNPGPTENDPSYDHIAVLENGQLQSYAAGPVQASATESNIKDGTEHVFAVQWNAGTDTLSVYFDGTLRLTYTKDVVNQIFGGNPEVYFGWTGSTGAETNIQYVRVSDVPCPPTPSPTATYSDTPTDTATETPTDTATWTPTDTPTVTDTPTETVTETPSDTPTETATETATWTPTNTSTPLLTIAKSVNLDVANPGDTLTYVVSFCDQAGAGPAHNVLIQDPIPEFTTYLWSSGPSDNPLVSSRSLDPGSPQTVTWNIPDLGAGVCSAVTMAVVVDPAINNALTSSGLPGGTLFHETFENPPYGLGTTITQDAGTLWQMNPPASSDADYFLIIGDPTLPPGTNQMGEARNHYPAEDPMESIAAFRGTSTLEYDVVMESDNTQVDLRLGSAGMGFDSNLTTFHGVGYVSVWSPQSTGKKIHCRIIYDPAQGIAKGDMVDSQGNVLMHNLLACDLAPVAGDYRISMIGTGTDPRDSAAMKVDNLQLCRGVANKVFISADGAAPQHACEATQIKCPEAATPTDTSTATGTATETATETPTWTPTHTATDTATLTATETQTETSTPTPLPASTCVIDWALVGTAQEGGNAITFTQAISSEAGAAWDTSRISLADSFAMTFAVYLGSNSLGGDGMGFVLQSEGLGAIGGWGQGLGFGNVAGELPTTPVSPSLDVEIDTWQNAGIGDPGYDHIGVLENGVLQTYAAGPVQASATEPNIKDGAEHVFAVQWNAGTDTLSVYFDGSLRVTYTKDVVNQIFGGNPEVYLGWTGSTGSGTNIQYVRVSDVPCPPTPSPTATCSDTPTDTATETPTETATWTPTETVTETPSHTPTDTPTVADTPTETVTETPSDTPTETATETATWTPTNTSTPLLTIAKSVNLDVANPGDTLTYVVSFCDQAGAGPAHNVLIQDPIPEFTTYLWSSGPSDNPLVSSRSLDPGSPQTVTWNIPDLGAGVCSAVTMAVVVDPAINNALTSSGLPGGTLFHETFENPPYGLGTTITQDAGTLWQMNPPASSDADYFLIIGDPTLPPGTNQMGEARNHYPAEDPMESMAAFRGTSTLEYDVVMESDNTQVDLRLGSAGMGFDSNLTTFHGVGYVSVWSPQSTGKKIHCRIIYDPAQGIAKGDMVDSQGNVLMHNLLACDLAPVAGDYRISMIGTGTDPRDSAAMKVDNLQLCRGVANKVFISADGAAPQHACEATQIKCPEAATPTDTVTVIVSPTETATLTPTLSPTEPVVSATPTFTATMTPTETPTATGSPGTPGEFLSSVFQEGMPTPGSGLWVVAAPNISRNGTPVKVVAYLEKTAQLRLTLFALTGEQVYSASTQGRAGGNVLLWPVRTQAGSPAASGLYLYILEADDGSRVLRKTGKVAVLH